MSTVVREAPHHRNLTCVKEYSCKRAECVARSLEYDRRRYRQKGYGTWQPFVDAEPARQHIGRLRALGHSLPGIEKAAEVSPATLSRILYDGVNKQARRIRPEVAERILRIPLQARPVTANTIVDATGTRRRLQALVAMGWPLKALGPQLGFHPRRLTDIIHGDRVLASTARRIAIGYRTVQARSPQNHGVPARSIVMARNLAAREGWHGPAAWDGAAIDDPDCQPEQTAAYGASPKYVRDNDRIAEIEHLYLLGESVDSIAKQLGGNRKYIGDQLAVVLRRRAEAARQEREEAMRRRLGEAA
ncbi:hypothetical protein ACFWPQ_02040 [Streptomyces sp. NPDC058464]|uniref:hypothetical protein n=1 Tax=Streptomyces sp. NPDC058464 TaxID=3346511 RepID=UPI003659849F